MLNHNKKVFILIIAALTGGCSEINDKSAEELLRTRSNILKKDSIQVRDIIKINRSTYCIELNAINDLGVYTGWGRTFMMLDDYDEFLFLTEHPGVLHKEQPDQTQHDDAADNIMNLYCPRKTADAAVTSQ